MGDVNGIGPEVVARAIVDPRVQERCQPIVVGPPCVLQQALELIDEPAKVHQIQSFDQPATGLVCLESAAGISVQPGSVTAQAGKLAHDCLRSAARAVGSGLDAICTAPLNKAALAAAGIDFPGHTEILADEFRVSDFAMLLHVSAQSLSGIRQAAGGSTSPHGMAIAHVTLHTSVESVPTLLNPATIADKIRLVDGFLKRLQLENPSVGVCALNPHAGEGGLFGDEEQRDIEPAVKTARSEGINVHGPFPADTLVRRAVLGEFQGVVAMYHDQGHIPVKLIAFDSAINVTLGIPIVRTSPTHGTAFDIAWQGKANPNGMIEAMLLATKLCTPSNSSLHSPV